WRWRRYCRIFIAPTRRRRQRSERKDMSNQAEKFLADLTRYISDSRELLGSGREVELKGLDEMAARLCESAGKLPADLRREYAERFEELIMELNALAEAITRRRD